MSPGDSNPLPPAQNQLFPRDYAVGGHIFLTTDASFLGAFSGLLNLTQRREDAKKESQNYIFSPQPPISRGKQEGRDVGLSATAMLPCSCDFFLLCAFAALREPIDFEYGGHKFG